MFKIIGVCFLVVLAFGAGMFQGWDAGVRDARHLVTCHTP